MPSATARRIHGVSVDFLRYFRPPSTLFPMANRLQFQEISMKMWERHFFGTNCSLPGCFIISYILSLEILTSGLFESKETTYEKRRLFPRIKNLSIHSLNYTGFPQLL